MRPNMLLPVAASLEPWLAGASMMRRFNGALLARPAWIFLDEATSNLDPEAETGIYRTLKSELPETTLVSIAHRPSVASFHEQHITFRRADQEPGRLEAI